MLMASAVVVWEWLNEHGRWRPYSPAVSHQIEAAIRSSDPRGGSVVLGQVDSRLAPYIIDLQSMHQFRQDTGTIRPVRRSFYDPTSAPGQGCQWEWENDAGTWTPYDMEVAIAIEAAHSRQQTCLDLTPLGFCYLIDYQSMTQVNRQSQRCRRIQRRADLAYPLVSGPLPKGGGVPTVPVKNLNGSSPVHPALAGITGILMSAAALPVCLTRPPKLVLHPPPVSKSDIKPVPGLGHCCRKTTKKQTRKGKTPEEVVKKYLQKVKSPPEEVRQLQGLSPGVGPVSRAESVGRLAQCGHQYHFQCLVAMYNNGNKDGSLQCPTCKTIYGVKTGNQPAGKMEYHVIPHSLPGHPDCKTIRIIYNIPPGIQGPEHSNPGKPYTARGFPRHCYLPDSEKGRKVLRLLLVAWDRRLIFSVGTSSTTGESDTVIWNEVHHKTEFGSNLTGHGFPDAGHLDNVLEELRAQGITEDDGLTEK
uniref:E3 ubiquitin-protein ligase n=1 Tax=Neogobius melanostomus TaxID=47308 RepID=A0A8C6TQ56_9GOBI